MTPYWQGDGITLYHADCAESLAWLDADVLITDPPYGIHQSSIRGENDSAFQGEYTTGRASDRVIGAEHVATRDRALARWLPRPGLVFGHWRAPRPPSTRMRLIWDKEHIGMGGVGAWRPTDEEIYVVGDWPNPKHEGGDQSTIIRWPRRLGKGRPDGHPTPKPVGLMEYLIGYSPPGVIADPFAGSGSTLLAARNLGRHAVGVEIEARFCRLAADRLAQGVLL